MLILRDALAWIKRVPAHRRQQKEIEERARNDDAQSSHVAISFLLSRRSIPTKPGRAGKQLNREVRVGPRSLIRSCLVPQFIPAESGCCRVPGNSRLPQRTETRFRHRHKCVGVWLVQMNEVLSGTNSGLAFNASITGYWDRASTFRRRHHQPGREILFETPDTRKSLRQNPSKKKRRK